MCIKCSDFRLITSQKSTIAFNIAIANVKGLRPKVTSYCPLKK